MAPPLISFLESGLMVEGQQKKRLKAFYEKRAQNYPKMLKHRKLHKLAGELTNLRAHLKFEVIQKQMANLA